jgi:hypothetical protein
MFPTGLTCNVGSFAAVHKTQSQLFSLLERTTMNEQQRRERNDQRVSELWPAFGAKIKAVIAELESQSLRPRIQDGYRSPADQLIAFQTGHSKLKYGFHNVTGTGGKKESLAVDMLDDDHPAQEKSEYLLRLAAAAESQGLVSGIRWGLPVNLSNAIDAAIANKDWKANVKVGWDPSHVQPTGITPQQAKAGKRPS